MKNIYLITILTLFISNCGEKVREEITERFDNGDKKLLVKYKGEGGDEVVVERITYSESGDTLLLEKPLEKIFMKRFYFDGLLKFEKNHKDGKMEKQILYYENGLIQSETNLKGGELDGKYIGWYENGKKKEEMNFKDEQLDGKWITYYESGNIQTETDYKDGKIDGKWTMYYENGQIYEETNYKDGEGDSKHTSYYENGQKQTEGTLKDGELISSKCWDEDGNEKECG